MSKSFSNTIYKTDAKGAIRLWYYEVDGGKWRSVSGIQSGKMTESKWSVSEAKNVGKKNATTAEQQAENEARAKLAHNLAREYRMTVNELADVPASPMLAQDYKAVTAKKPLAFPVYSQPKLDGIRATISARGAFSREYQPHFNAQHIIAALAPVFAKYPDLVLDGELYNHDLKDDFNALSSVIRSQQATLEQLDLSKRVVQFHVYDIIGDHKFGVRAAMALRIVCGISNSWVQCPIHIVPTSWVTNQASLDQLYGEYMQDGYEGQMVRLDAHYDRDLRSASLLKRKTFDTAEFPLVRFEAGNGNWSGAAKRAIVIGPQGKEEPCGMRGTRDKNYSRLQDQFEGIKPKIATVRYFGLTPGGALRFPVAIDYDRAD